MRRLASHRLRDLIGVAVLPNHSGIGDGWSGGVNLLGAIELEAVAAVERDRSWVLFRYPQHGGCCPEHLIQQGLTRATAVVGSQEVDRVELVCSRRVGIAIAG